MAIKEIIFIHNNLNGINLMNIKLSLPIFVVLLLEMGCQKLPPIEAQIADSPKTFCNPVNLNYRFMKIDGGDGIREAADPVVVYFKEKYYLFASKSSGYWVSDDFVNWKHVFISDSILPIEDYAPGLFVHNDALYYVGSTHGKGQLFRSIHPEKGEWEPVKEIWSYWDPAFYVENNLLYMYHGCSPVDPIHMQVLDLNTLEAQTKIIDCFNSNKEQHGWERTGERNELSRRPYIEGAWMTEHNGKYYLQYAAPGTEWKSYADGTYVSDSPTGPFSYMENSPVSYKLTGFIGGAGHGCLFQVGKDYWKAATNSISVRHMFERRISFYPAGFDSDDYLYTDTYLGDYPMYLPTVDSVKSRPDWMLLSFRKPVTASSCLSPEYSVNSLVDEDVRTAWVAAGNSDKEWVQIDLQEISDVSAIQINYDEYGATQKGFTPVFQSYNLWASYDGERWYLIADRSEKKTDTPHDYIEFETPFAARYIKWENKAYTISDHVSLRELRIFGKGRGSAPHEVSDFAVLRDTSDSCKATVSWTPVEGAVGYIIRSGIAPDKLYHNFQVTDSCQFELPGLNAGVTYYFTIDSYNENGITYGERLIESVASCVKKN